MRVVESVRTEMRKPEVRAMKRRRSLHKQEAVWKWMKRDVTRDEATELFHFFGAYEASRRLKR